MIPDFDWDWAQFDYEWAIIRNTTTVNTNYGPRMDWVDTNVANESWQGISTINANNPFDNVDFNSWINTDQDEEPLEISQHLTASPLTSWPGSTSASTLSSTTTPQSTYSPLTPSQTSPQRTTSPIRIAPKPGQAQPKQIPIHRYACPDCPLTFARNCDLNRHARQHLKPIPCPVAGCGERKATRRDMQRHVQTRHPESEIAQPLLLASRFACEVKMCKQAGVVFKRKDHLVRHQRKVHGMERKVP